jgi:hypothetical protein
VGKVEVRLELLGSNCPGGRLVAARQPDRENGGEHDREPHRRDHQRDAEVVDRLSVISVPTMLIRTTASQ